MKPSEVLTKLRIALPTPPSPVGSYVPGIRTGDLILVSGQIPLEDGKLTLTGKVGSDATLEAAQQAARRCVLAGLAIAAEHAGGIDSIEQVVRVGVFVNSAPGFTDQPKVANGASDVLVEIFGDAGRHVRAAVGVNELPLDAAVEVELMVRARA